MTDFDLEGTRARQAEARAAAAQELDQHYQLTAAERVEAIVACELCDDDGYRGTVVCDHREHYASTAKGRAAVQAELAKIRARQGSPA